MIHSDTLSTTYNVITVTRIPEIKRITRASFTHDFGFTTLLSCHELNFVTDTLLTFEWEQTDIFIEFESWWKNRSWNGPHYTPEIMHPVSLCYALLWVALLCFGVVSHLWLLPISFRVASLALEAAFDCCSSSETTLTMMTSPNGNVFHVTGPLWGETTGQRWLPLTKDQ